MRAPPGASGARTPSPPDRAPRLHWPWAAQSMMRGMEGAGFGDIFGDPDELQRRLAEFAEQMQGNQRLAWADNAIKLAVDMTVAAVERINLQGDAEAQADQIRTVMALVFPDAVT